MTAVPSRAALTFLCALVALGGAFVLGLYALTSPDDRPGLIDSLQLPLAAAVAAVPAMLAWLRGEQLRKTQTQIAEQVGQVVHQTNGNLDARIESANVRLRDELLAALIPTQPASPTDTTVPARPLAGYDPPEALAPPVPWDAG